MLLYIHRFIKHLSSAYFKPGTMMAHGIENQIKHGPCYQGAFSLEEAREK